jgi:hypothetical protein
MNKLDSKHQQRSFEISTASHSDMEPVGRLIVLVPADSDYATATRRIWELAIATGTRIQFLGLCKDAAQEPSLRRELVTMSALVQDGKVSTEATVEIGTSWVDVVKRNYQTGDMIVCFAEQRAGLLQRPLSQMLNSELDAPVYIITGLYGQKHLSWNWISQTLAWSGFIGIMIGFFWLQVEIDQLPRGVANITLLILSIPAEIWLIWVWNNLFR